VDGSPLSRWAVEKDIGLQEDCHLRLLDLEAGQSPESTWID
jgi:hypothetical protein